MLKEGYLFLDGAMGTMLFEAGLKMGERPEEWCIKHPKEVTKIHQKYIEAGSQL
ncbi:MAG TPA: homocysteine S-methyltransferase family protein, partial [Lachnospiraceae bacterium]